MFQIVTFLDFVSFTYFLRENSRDIVIPRYAVFIFALLIYAAKGKSCFKIMVWEK